VSVTLGPRGAVTAVAVVGRELPPGGTAGGVFPRELIQADEGPALMAESREDGLGTWEPWETGGRIDFSATA